MNFVKKLVFASLLVFTLSLNTFAGEQEIPANPNPNKLVTTTTTDEGTDPISDPYTGDITTDTSDYLFIEALAALLSVY
jgi:hypothetical protein